MIIRISSKYYLFVFSSFIDQSLFIDACRVIPDTQAYRDVVNIHETLFDRKHLICDGKEIENIMSLIENYLNDHGETEVIVAKSELNKMIKRGDYVSLIKDKGDDGPKILAYLETDQDLIPINEILEKLEREASQ